MATYDVYPDVYPVPRIVDASRATAWLGDSWKLFAAAPGVWIAIGVVIAIAHVMLGILPAIGGIAYTLLLPVLAAGLMEASRIAAAGDAPPFEAMFAGFRQGTGNLVMVGLLALGALFVIGVVVTVILLVGGGTGLFASLKHFADSGRVDVATSVASIGMAMLSLALASLISLVLVLPLTMAMWFAPALVFFDKLPPLAAMKSSFAASLHNWLPLTIYGVLAFVLMFIASITVIGLLIVGPLLAISVYLSYRDIYRGITE